MSKVITEKRGVLLSRSTYLGSGVHTGHFIKENAATWEDMAHSIVGLLSFSFVRVIDDGLKWLMLGCFSCLTFNCCVYALKIWCDCHDMMLFN